LGDPINQSFNSFDRVVGVDDDDDVDKPGRLVSVKQGKFMSVDLVITTSWGLLWPNDIVIIILQTESKNTNDKSTKESAMICDVKIHNGQLGM